MGQRFTRLTVIEEAGINKQRNYLWKCRCDCGNINIVNGSDLRGGRSKSCGCLAIDKATKHGMAWMLAYPSWLDMIRRCNNPKDKGYKNYGGRGITVCDRWLKLENFIEDMGERPEGLTIERIDNNGNYEPGNCCWATYTTQLRNQRVKKTNHTGFNGISWREDRKKYQVRIQADEKQYHVGYFINLQRAIEARQQAELKYWA